MQVAIWVMQAYDRIYYYIKGNIHKWNVDNRLRIINPNYERKKTQNSFTFFMH